MFNSKRLSILSIVLLIIISISLAVFFTDRRFSLDLPFSLWDKAIQFVLSDTEDHLAVDNNVIKSANTDMFQLQQFKPDQLKQSEQLKAHTPQADKTSCSDVSLGKIQYQRQGNIYSWKDEKGIQHFSNTKPNFDADIYDIKPTTTLDYFKLTLHTPNLPPTFKRDLQIKLNSVFKIYGQIIGLKALKKVDLSLTVLPSRALYDAAIKQQGADPTHTQGMYFHATNSAFIHFNNQQSAMRTAIHESVHAINKAVLGETPKWLNEGLAEYFEFSKNTIQLAAVEPNTDWTRNHKLLEQPFTLNQLFALEQKWQSNQVNKHYASSWAAIYFLMDSDKGQRLLKDIMLAEQAAPCTRLSPLEIKNKVYAELPNIEQKFAHWQQLSLKDHRF